MDRLTVIPEDREFAGGGKCAAILYFDDEVSLEAAKLFLTKLLDDKASDIESAVVGEYNANWGSPVWYIP